MTTYTYVGTFIFVFISTAVLGQTELTLTKMNGKKTETITSNRIVGLATTESPYVLNGQITTLTNSSITIQTVVYNEQAEPKDTTITVNMGELRIIYYCRKKNIEKCPDKVNLAIGKSYFFFMLGPAI